MLLDKIKKLGVSDLNIIFENFDEAENTVTFLEKFKKNEEQIVFIKRSF